MLRVSPGALEYVKSSLKLVDGLPVDQQQRMPTLPAMEFDADEEVVLSPMQLLWDNHKKKLPPSMVWRYDGSIMYFLLSQGAHSTNMYKDNQNNTQYD